MPLTVAGFRTVWDVRSPNVLPTVLSMVPTTLATTAGCKKYGSATTVRPRRR